MDRGCEVKGEKIDRCDFQLAGSRPICHQSDVFDIDQCVTYFGSRQYTVIKYCYITKKTFIVFKTTPAIMFDFAVSNYTILHYTRTMLKRVAYCNR